MNITVCCCTYDRPEYLRRMLYCFERQTHEDRALIVLDDSGRLGNHEGDRWRIISEAARFASLGVKRNAVAQLAGRTDALVVWDDDDLYLPHALEATADALGDAPWSRPSIACLSRQGGTLQRVRTWNRPDETDKAFQCCWGIHRDVFWEVGGYSAMSRGEDCDLARRLLAAGVTECDPIELGHLPWYIWGPWHNRHLTHQPYTEWPEPGFGVQTMLPEPPPGFDLERPVFSERINKRPGPEDWFCT